jgi:hypothetical protein
MGASLFRQNGEALEKKEKTSLIHLANVSVCHGGIVVAARNHISAVKICLKISRKREESK